MPTNSYRGFELPPPGVPYPYRRELEASWELSEWARELPGDRPFNVRHGADRIVHGEFVRSMNNYLALLCLAVDGFGVQAEYFARPMFEGFLTAWWAHRNPEQAHERFELYATYLERLNLESRAATGFYEDVPAPPPMSEQDEEKAVKLFGSRGERSLTGKSTYALVNEVLEERPRAGDRSHLQIHQEHVHRLVNLSLHSTPYSLKRVAQPDDDHPGEGLAVMGTSDLAVRDALVLGWNCVVEMCDVFMEHFDLSSRKELEAVTFRVWRAFKGPDVVDALGRNDPCPCKSGLKYKHCHDRLRRGED